MKEYIVTKDILNIRSSATDVDDTNYVGSLNRGATIFLTDEEINGKIPFGGSSPMWKADHLNNMVSRDAVEPKVITATTQGIEQFKSVANFPNVPINWNGKVKKIPNNIKIKGGSGISVGVLDSGIERQHLDLSRNVIESIDFTKSAVADLDVQGHGTAMASLIAAYPFSKNGITGIAPNVLLRLAKVMYDQNDPQDFSSVELGMRHLLERRVDIINMSIGRPFVAALPSIQHIISLTGASNNTVFFASTKEYNDDNDLSRLTDLFPANCPGVIPVCSLTKSLIEQHWNSLPAPLIIIPDFNAWCCSIKHRHYYFQEAGSSISTALMAGITALLLAQSPSVNRSKQGILSLLTQYASTVDEAFQNIGSEIHYIIKN
ncbi:S8 family peptidase [Mucilaginibacter pocheonensis]|uniref:Subtilisin family serine protease n=1 Tax=Mucilaginibacter pocheonensis TaxID=398050 RepID=A0ABU1TA35_9SPHI|nr:S8/S53 family peptidase [Mucilaginibacter pocheonensis]MDR6941685.1 subtilisin family serine protease [Mucilaginibacter pocheonensis]